MSLHLTTAQKEGVWYGISSISFYPPTARYKLSQEFLSAAKIAQWTTFVVLMSLILLTFLTLLWGHTLASGASLATLVAVMLARNYTEWKYTRKEH